MSLSYVLIIALLTIISKSSHGQQGHATQRGEMESPRFIKNKRDHFTLVKTNRLLSEVNQEDYRDPKSLVELEKLLNEANSKTVKNEERQSSLPASRSRLSELHRTGSYQQSATEASATKNNNSPRLGGPAKQPSSHRRASTTCAGMKKIVQCKDGVPEEDCKSTLVDQGIEVVSDMPKTPYFSICAYSQEEVDLVAELTSVEDVEDDPPRTLSYVRGSEKLVRQLQFNEQVVPYGVDLVKAREFWGEYRAQGEGVTVCVIDTGLLSSHEDVREGDLSGSKDKDFETWDEDPNSHGTHVTGTIMANDNNIGIVGVAPGASVFVVRVFNEVGDFTASNLIVAMMACEEAGAKIISMSLGGTVNNAAERAAVTRLQDSGILIVAASGNSATGPNMIEYPASYDATMSVGAVGEDAQMAVFSSHNSALDITGPGVDILSLSSFTDAAYSLKSGTSMATPHIAAVAALLWSHFPEASVMDIRTALQETAQDYGACGKDPVFGHGMVDVMAAALYLDNGGVNSTAPELDGCVGVSVSLLTDDWGEETTYRITSENNTQDILYRGGPYVTGQRVTYTEDIQLPDGCYQLIWLDSYGDGANNLEYGIGSISLTYNGREQVEFDDLAGFNKVFKFGNCVADAPSPSPTQATASPNGSVCGNGIVEDGEECDDGNLDNTDSCLNICELARCGDGAIQEGVEECDGGDGCSSTCTVETVEASDSTSCSPGESLLELRLLTDRWARSENYLYFYDDATPDDERIWSAEPYALEGNSQYDGSHCLDPSRCYLFFFFDSWGDGFLAGGRLTLTLDGTDEVLDVIPGDTGTDVGDSGTTTFWSQEFGPCTSVSSNNDRSYSVPTSLP